MYHVWLYTGLLQALKGECLSSVFSSDGTFNFCICSFPLQGRLNATIANVPHWQEATRCTDWMEPWQMCLIGRKQLAVQTEWSHGKCAWSTGSNCLHRLRGTLAICCTDWMEPWQMCLSIRSNSLYRVNGNWMKSGKKLSSIKCAKSPESNLQHSLTGTWGEC